MQRVYSEKCTKTARVLWYERFREVPRLGRPSLLNDKELIGCAQEVFRDNPRISVRKLAASLAVSVGSAHAILTKLRKSTRTETTVGSYSSDTKNPTSAGSGTQQSLATIQLMVNEPKRERSAKVFSKSKHVQKKKSLQSSDGSEEELRNGVPPDFNWEPEITIVDHDVGAEAGSSGCGLKPSHPSPDTDQIGDPLGASTSSLEVTHSGMTSGLNSAVPVTGLWGNASQKCKKDPLFLCCTCNITYYYIDDLIAHDTWHKEAYSRKKSSYVCFACKLAFNSSKDFKKHETLHNEGNYKCNTCGKWFVSLAFLKAHMQGHKNLNVQHVAFVSPSVAS